MLKLYKTTCSGKRNIYFNTFFFSNLLQSNGGYNFDSVKNWHKKETKELFTEKYHRIYVPVNINGAHWALLVVGLDLKKIMFYDFLSTDTSSNEFMNGMLRYLSDMSALYKNKDFDIDAWDLIKVDDSPQQKNGNDCGVFVLINIYCLIHDLPLSYNQEDVYHSRSREIILRSLKQKELLPPVTYFSFTSLPGFDPKEKKVEIKKQPREKETTNEKYVMPMFDPNVPNYILMTCMIDKIPGRKKNKKK